MDRTAARAIAFSLLLVSSMVATGVAAESPTVEPAEHPGVASPAPATQAPGTLQDAPADDARADPARPNVTDDGLAPRQRLLLANLTVHDLDPDADQQRRALARATDELRPALDSYGALRATDRRAFDSQARALQALARATGGEYDATLENVSAGVVRASIDTARIAIADANRSRHRFADDLDRNAERFAENALRQSRRALDRADAAVARGGTDDGRHAFRRTIRARADAIDHYRQAFHHANRAMERLERSVEPDLSLSQGRAFERNGSVLVPLRGTLSDVRPGAYDRASVSLVNGTGTAAPLRFGPAAPGATYATGSTLVDLGANASDATVTVRANASQDRVVEETLTVSVTETEVVPDPPAPDEYGEATVSASGTNASVTARGDGVWERTVSVTNETPARDAPFRAGPVVRVQNRTSFANATVRLPIQASVPASEYGTLSVYTWNGSAQDHWRPIQTRIENGTAVADVDHFSFFTVIDTDEWRSYTEYAPEDGRGDPIAFEQQDGFDCSDACNVTNATTLTLGGEPSAQQITIEQGNRSFDVVPLSNGQPIEEFYDFGSFQINSPLPIAESDASQLFFWAGTEGLSLVALHDEPDDGSGGAVDLAFDGLPLDAGSWVIEDDGDDFDAGSSTRPAWRWSHRRTDGGAFRGGLANETIEITPHFNADATRWDAGRGILTEWQVLTGQATDPEAVQLDMTEPVTIRVPEAPTENGSAPDLQGNTGTATWNDTLAAGTDQFALVSQTEQTDVDPNATVVVRGENGAVVRHQLTIGTVGTVEETLDVSALSGEIAYNVSASGVNARVQVVPEGGRQDTDGDGLPDDLERRTWATTNGPPTTFTTSPYQADSDGDGISDGEEVEFARTGSDDGAYEVRTTTNPAAADTDGDGLTDAVESESWQIQYTNSSDATRDFLRVLQESSENELPDLDAYLATEAVTSNPVAADTDGDGLSDLAERRMGTNPEAVDTTGDGVRDGEAAEYDADPTLFDHAAPELRIFDSWVDAPAWSFGITYGVEYRVFDPATVDSVVLRRDGNHERTYDVDERERRRTREIEGGAFDRFVTRYGGASLTVEATDVHDNSRSRRSVPIQDVFGEASARLAESGIVGSRQVRDLGRFSGFSTAGAETVDFAYSLYQDPVGYARAIDDAVARIDDLPEIVQNLPAGIEAQQRRNNPHDREQEPDLYRSYRQGWYEGYAGYMLVELALPAGEVGRVVTSSDRIRAAAQTLDRTGHMAQAARYASRANQLARAPVRITGHHLSRVLQAGVGFGADVAGRTLDASRTAVGQYRLAEQIRRFDPGLVERLPAELQRWLGAFTARHGDAGRRLVTDGGTDVRALLRGTEVLDEATSSRLVRAYDRGSIDADDVRRVTQAVEEGTIDGIAVRRSLVRVRELEHNGHDVQRLRTAEEVNAGYDPGTEDPYAAGTLAVEYVSGTSDEFVRAHRANNQARSWLARERTIRGLEADEIQDRLSLLREPTYVSDVTVPEGTPMRTGTIEANFGGERGATQFELRARLNPENFNNQREPPI